NGVFTLRVVGSSFAPLLQIVPMVTAVDVNGVNSAQIQGSGFVEGNGTVYQWANGSVVDADTGTLTNVFSSGTRVNLTLPTTYGPGLFTVTTVGGTSAPLADNGVNTGRGFLRDLAIDRTTNQAWLITNDTPAQVHRIDLTTGQSLGTFSLTAAFGVTSFYGGLQFLQTGLTLGGTAVPAGSLLLVQGASNPDRILAVNATTGAILATLVLPTNFEFTSGIYDAVTGHIFAASYSGTNQPPDKVFELDPATGAVLNSFVVPSLVFPNGDIVHSGLALDPTSGNLWLGSSQSTVVVELTKTGTVVRTVDLLHQGLAVNELTGIAFDGTGALWVSTSNGVLLKMNLALNLAQPTATITSVTALAQDGTPTNGGQASANAGQTIELIGTGFGPTTQVLFPTHDQAGNDGVVSVLPTVVNAAGTKLQVVVPLLASTGQVRVTNTGLRDLGFSSFPDAIYRDVTVNFTASGTTASITITDEGLEGLANESWGLDNVRVRLASNPGTVLYSENFEGGTGAEWNTGTTDATQPWAFTEFLGRVSSDGRTLTVSGLTAGVQYQLVTDLYILDSWEGTAGPDYIDVFVDGQRQFHEAFSYTLSQAQTYAPGVGATLQIVPVIYGLANGKPGEANVFDLLGSGFMEGASTITIGGIALVDQYKNQSDDDVFDTGSVLGAGNDSYRLVAPLTVEGPIRITTAGGSYQFAGPVFGLPAFVELTGIVSAATSGAPTNAGVASANTGQTIVLTGNGFTSATLVQFDAQDDQGVNGTLTRTGTANA
ncbi:MAG: hypothetical protein ABL935_07115, partial [Nitrospiraceae bacterium]